MRENPVFVVIEIVSVQNPEGLKTYIQQASQLIGPLGGEVVAQGGIPIDGEQGFAPLVIQRWPSKAALRAWLESADYKPLNEIRVASATMKVAIVPIITAPLQS
jgi:uncharacterized protein (DUF1330 family)